jgi:uncharacterized membrane protein YhiD involved in acid resistance
MIHSPNILIALKLLMAVAGGGAIGFERELSANRRVFGA